MKFRRDEENLKVCIGACLMLEGMGIGFILTENLPFFGVTMAILGIIVFFASYTVDGRTITMDESGCEIQIWRIKRRYAWEEFKVKRIETVRNLVGSDRWLKEYNEGVIFSTHKVRKPKWMHPYIYETFLNPFTFFCIYFTPRGRGQITHGKYYYIREIEETEFLEKMKSWNVELEDARVRYRKRL